MNKNVRFSGAGKVIKRFRERQKLTPVAFADRIGISRDALSHIEANRRPVTHFVLSKMAEHFDIPIETLMLACLREVDPAILRTVEGRQLRRLAKMIESLGR
jgi:transcriptional regulator with XRE-family HTH domain